VCVCVLIYAYIYIVQDIAASGAAIMTSSLGSLLVVAQSGGGNTHPLTYDSVKTDSEFEATVTLAANAVNNLMFHIFLAPIYAVIVAQKILVCTDNAVLAIPDAIGFNVKYLGRSDLQEASGGLVGTCMSERGSAATETPAQPASQKTAVSIATELLSATGELMSSIFMEPAIHTFDGIVSYLIGIVRLVNVSQ